MIGRTNSQVTGGTPSYTELTVFVPPSMTDLSQMFSATCLRDGNATIHKDSGGSAITNLSYLFRFTNSNRTLTFDFDTSSVTNWSNMFSRSGAGSLRVKLTINGTLDFTSATNVGTMFTDWMYDANYQSSFRLAEGSLGISWNLGNCNPDDDTLASIIAGLKDMTGGTAQTLTLNTNVKARLTAEQTAIVAAKNWVLA